MNTSLWSSVGVSFGFATSFTGSGIDGAGEEDYGEF